MPGDDEERVNAAVAAPVGIELEARFPDRSVWRDERRDGVPGESQVRRHPEQGILRRAGAADGRLTVTAHAAHEIEGRADAVRHPLLLHEFSEASREHLTLLGGQAGDRSTRAGGTAPDAGIPGPEEIGLDGLTGYRANADERDDLRDPEERNGEHRE